MKDFVKILINLALKIRVLINKMNTEIANPDRAAELAYAELPHREMINEKHAKLEKKYSKRRTLSMFLGIIVALAGLAKSVHRIIESTRPPIIKKYNAISSTLYELKTGREGLPPLPTFKVPYEKQEIRKHLDNASGNFKKGTGSLDKAIEIVEADLAEIKKIPEVKAYIDESSSIYSIYSPFLHATPGFATMLLGPTYYALRLSRNRKKKKQEIADLESSAVPTR